MSTPYVGIKFNDLRLILDFLLSGDNFIKH
nr:MAG TPA: Protein of unknown function (DUF2982) [Caudoviricetes sp.]